MLWYVMSRSQHLCVAEDTANALVETSPDVGSFYNYVNYAPATPQQYYYR